MPAVFRSEPGGRPFPEREGVYLALHGRRRGGLEVERLCLFVQPVAGSDVVCTFGELPPERSVVVVEVDVAISVSLVDNHKASV